MACNNPQLCPMRLTFILPEEHVRRGWYGRGPAGLTSFLPQHPHLADHLVGFAWLGATWHDLAGAKPRSESNSPLLTISRSWQRHQLLTCPHDSLGWGIEKSELYTWVRSLTEQTHGITFLISQTSWTNMFVWFWSCCPVCREKQPEFCVVWVAFHSLGLRRGWRGKDCALIWIFSADFANIAVASVRETAMYLMQHYETLCNTMQHYATQYCYYFWLSPQHLKCGVQR